MASNKEKMIEKLGSEKAYLDWLSDNARKGGSWRGPKGTAMFSASKLRKISSKGGKVKHAKTV